MGCQERRPKLNYWCCWRRSLTPGGVRGLNGPPRPGSLIYHLVQNPPNDPQEFFRHLGLEVISLTGINHTQLNSTLQTSSHFPRIVVLDSGQLFRPPIDGFIVENPVEFKSQFQPWEVEVKLAIDCVRSITMDVKIRIKLPKPIL